MSDYISREAAVDAIRDAYGDSYRAEDYIRAIPAADVRPKWIPVTDKLPKKERANYLCFTNMGVVCECRWTNNQFGFGESENWGWSVIDTPQYQKVTHWMPLPEPPKEEHDG